MNHKVYLMAKLITDDEFDMIDIPTETPKAISIGEHYRNKSRLTCSQLYEGLAAKGIGTGKNIIGDCKLLGKDKKNNIRIYLSNQAFTDIENNVPPHQVNFTAGLETLQTNSKALLAGSDTAYILIPTTLARTKADEKEWISRAHFVLSIVKLTQDKTPQLMVIDSNASSPPALLYKDSIQLACKNSETPVNYHGYFYTGKQTLFDHFSCGYNVIQTIQDILESRFNLKQAFNLLPQQKLDNKISRAGQGISLGSLTVISLVIGAILTGLSPTFPVLLAPGITMLTLGGGSALVAGIYLGVKSLANTGRINYQPTLKMDDDAAGFKLKFANNPLAQLRNSSPAVDAVQEEIKTRLNKLPITEKSPQGHSNGLTDNTVKKPQIEIPNDHPTQNHTKKP